MAHDATPSRTACDPASPLLTLTLTDMANAMHEHPKTGLWLPSRRRVLTTIAATTAAAGVAPGLILPPSVAHADSKAGFRWEGEEIYYSVEVSGAEAARASIRSGARKKTKGVSYVPVQAKAITRGFFGKSYPLNDNADTFINPGNLKPIKADKFIRENGKERTYKVRYKDRAFTATVIKTVKGKKARNFDRAIPRGTYDALSWFYAMRAKPLKNKDKYTFVVFDGWKMSRLHVRVVGRDKIWTPMGYYKSVKLDIDREIVSSHWTGDAKTKDKGRKGVTLKTRIKPKYLATLHVTDDDIRVPVRLLMTSKMGDSDFRLIKYEAPTGKTAPHAEKAKTE